MNSTQNNIKQSNGKKTPSLRKLPFTHGVEIENFITDKRGDILEDGKELVAVWDQMFNGAYQYLKSLTASSTKVPEFIRRKIKSISKKDVQRHGKIIRYVQMEYVFNGKSISINVFGPDPNISQITWLLELVTPPCEYLEELDWWINTLYLAASQSITSGYDIQPLGFNPYQTEYRAGVTCGEHHHLGNFKNKEEKFAAYNMIRAYIPHLIALSSTSPFIDGKPIGRIILKKGEDNRTLILAPDCTRSYRLKQNSGQLGPNIPEYLPHLTKNYTQTQFSRHVRKEIPDDRYVDVSPFTSYGTIECRFIDTQYDQNIRLAIIIMLQALALKGVKFVRAGKEIPAVRGNTIYEHRKRAVEFGMFAKFQGDPSIESTGGIFAKYYNHNPEDGGPPGKIFESLRALLIWLKPEFKELRVNEDDLLPLFIMLWGTQRIAPPISATTFMLYNYEQSQSNIGRLIKGLSLLNGRPRTIFNEYLGRPVKTFSELLSTQVSKPTKTQDSTRSALARKLQQDSKKRRKTAMIKERARLKAKREQQARIQREQIKKERELERKKQERQKLLEKATKPPPKPMSTRKYSPPARTKKVSTKKTASKTGVKAPARTTKKTVKQKTTSTRKRSKPKKPSTKPKATSSSSKKRKYSISKSALKKIRGKSRPKPKPQAYASTSTQTTSRTRNSSFASITNSNISKSTKKITKTKIRSKPKIMKSSTKTVGITKVTSEDDYFKESKFVKNFSVHNFPSKFIQSIIVPTIKIKWQNSLVKAKSRYSIKIEAEFIPIKSNKAKKGKVFQEIITLERFSLKEFCYLPIPIDLENYTGDFQIRFTIYDQRTRNTILSLIRNGYKGKPARDKKTKITTLSIPANQAGETKVKLAVNLPKKNIRGKITLLGISQKGLVKLYEKKRRFKKSRFTVNLPITIPMSICSSDWYVMAKFNARGISESAIVKSTPPLTKLVNVALTGNPPLKTNINPDFRTEITPKIRFKVNSSIKQISIVQIVDGKKAKRLKKYKLRSRIKRGEKFVLESFDWKAPSMRKGLFRKHKKRTVTFHCQIIDEIGIVSNSLIGLIETPRIAVYS